MGQRHQQRRGAQVERRRIQGHQEAEAERDGRSAQGQHEKWIEPGAGARARSSQQIGAEHAEDQRQRQRQQGKEQRIAHRFQRGDE